jgi:hypothetical protein
MYYSTENLVDDATLEEATIGEIMNKGVCGSKVPRVWRMEKNRASGPASRTFESLHTYHF